MRPMDQFRENGLLWYINRVAFHPRGFALGVDVSEDGNIIGWTILGDGHEVWTFSNEDDDDNFAKIEYLFQQYREMT